MNVSPTVTFIVVARNAARYLPDLFSDILCQDYPENLLEIIFVDGRSTDSTRVLMEQFAVENCALTVQVLDNPRLTLSTGWNIALRAACGSIVMRVDAQSRFPASFVRKSVGKILDGEMIAGGSTISYIPSGSLQTLCAIADSSRFGGGAAPFRNAGDAGYVDTIAYAAYRREVFSRVGGLDERLPRNQDNEIHARMRKSGLKFYFDPEIQAFHRPRTRWQALLSQKFVTGLWIGPVLSIQPLAFSIRHYAPLAFVVVMIILLALMSIGFWIPMASLGAVYTMCAMWFAAKATFNDVSAESRKLIWLLPTLFFAIHMAYGIGTLVGFARTPVFMFRTRGYQVSFPIKDDADI